jgi:hypothetical protein
VWQILPNVSHRRQAVQLKSAASIHKALRKLPPTDAYQTIEFPAITPHCAKPPFYHPEEMERTHGVSKEGSSIAS